MQIRIRATGQVMYGEEFNRTICSLPITHELLEQYGADLVFEGPQATGGTVYQYSQHAGVEQINGKWYTKYILGPVFEDYTKEDGTVVTAAEAEAAYKAQKDLEQSTRVREDRNRKLSETDWRFRSDMTPSQEWKDYCQALRDVPNQDGFPWNVIWPTKPE